MGCGSSSATNVDPQAVTVERKKDASDVGGKSASASSPEEQSVSARTHAQSTADGNLEVETEAEAGVRSPGREDEPPDYETVLLQQRREEEEREREKGQSSQKAVAFDVALSSDGQFVAKKPLPKRLEKLDDVSKLTPEVLAERQRNAEENRQKELNKRADVGKRLSKKDRLRREIQDARFSEQVLQLEGKSERKLSASEENRLRQQEEMKDRLRRREEHAKKVRARKESNSDAAERESFSSAVEIETDQGYNDRNDDGNWTTSQADSTTHHPVATRSEDDGFFDDSDGLDYAATTTVEPSHSNEEYM